MEVASVKINHLAHKYGQAQSIRKINYVSNKRPAVSFLEAEELGTNIPNHCASHANCRNCFHRAQEMSRREQEEC